MKNSFRKIKNLSFVKILKFTWKASFVSLFSYLSYWQLPFVNKVQIIYSKNTKNERLAQSLQPIDYKPSFYMPKCFSQMIFNEIKGCPNVDFKRQYVATHDEGCIALDWVVNSNEKSIDKSDKDESNKKMIIILHGLTGGSESNYIRELIKEFQNHDNYKIVVVNYRGIGTVPLLTPFIYNVGYTEDIKTALDYIKENYKDYKSYAIGTSMGGNILTKLLGSTEAYNNYIKGFISISNPLNCSEVEKRNRGKILDYFLIKRQTSYLNKHRHVLNDYIGKIIYLFISEYDKLSSLKSYREYDELITCKLFGFKDAEEYYHTSSSMHYIENIKVPTLFINSLDDLLSPIDSVDLNKCK